MTRSTPSVSLARAVGIDDSVEGDLISDDILVGDRFVLCSDGSTSRKLIEAANARAGKDNVTVIVVDVEGILARRSACCRSATA